MTRALVVEARGLARTLAVRFRPGGATPFLRVSAHALTDREIDCDDLGVGWLAPAALREAPDVDLALRVLEGALLARLPGVRAPDPRLDQAVHALLGTAPPSIAQLAQRLDCSRQHLARVFQAHVGVGPKVLGKVARLHRAVGRLQCGRSSLAHAAVELGYFDEAHMDRDFRQLLGVTPGGVQAAAGSIRPIHSLFDQARLADEQAHPQPDRRQGRR
jgi:AraC-like DNA-binding protein